MQAIKCGKTFGDILRAKDRLKTFYNATNLNSRNKRKALNKYFNYKIRHGKFVRPFYI